MPLPGDVATRVVHGQWLDMAGASRTGSVTITPSGGRLVSVSGQVVLTGAPITVELDADGEIAVTLPTTDDADVIGSPWTYMVVVELTGEAPEVLHIQVPTAPGPLELAPLTSVSPVPPTAGAYVPAATVGVCGGPAGPLDADGLIPADQIPGGSGGVSLADADDFPGSIGAFNQVGIGTTAARSDHSHSGEVAGAVAAHVAAVDPHGDRAYAAAAVAAHEADTTAVHGIANTALLETTSGATTKVATHAAATDPHGDRAYADAAVAGRVPTGRTITAGALLTGGGDLSSDRTLAVADRGLLTRDAMIPAGRYESRSRLDSGVGSSTIASGTLYLVPVWLPSGLVVNAITFVSGTTAASSPTNQWFALFSSARALLAVTANDTTAAWAANSGKTLAVATTAGGAASSYTTVTEGLHYLGLMVAATTPPSIHGGGAANAALAAATPGVGASNTGLSSTPAFPFTANSPAAGGPLAYAYVS